MNITHVYSYAAGQAVPQLAHFAELAGMVNCQVVEQMRVGRHLSLVYDRVRQLQWRQTTALSAKEIVSAIDVERKMDAHFSPFV